MSEITHNLDKKRFIDKIKNMIKDNRKLYISLYRIYLPIKNKTIFQKHYVALMNDLNRSKKNKKIFFIGIPTHSNLGDQAQYLLIKKWLETNFKDYTIIEVADWIVGHNYKNTIGEIKKNTNNDDIFVFQSGYRTTDISNFEGEYAHRTILNNFENKVIVFPQTVNFKLEKEKMKSSQAYEKNNNYVFMARDEISYKTALTIYNKKRVLLYPDIVTSLIGNFDLVNTMQKRDGILFCLRNDDEKLYTDKEYDILIDNLKKITYKIDITDTNSSKYFEFDRSEALDELQKKLDQFASYKLIITDRFHGTIFSLISNTPVIVLNSTDHKLSSGVNWFKNVYDDYVYYCNNLNNVYELASDIYKKKLKPITKAYFQKKYYDKLYEKVNNINHMERQNK